MATLSPVNLGIIITAGFLPPLLGRAVAAKKFIDNTEPTMRPKRAFILEVTVCLSGALLVNGYNYLVLGFPVYSLTSFSIGCIIAGFFIGLDSSLGRERQTILQAMEEGEGTILPTRFFSLSRKYALVAGTTSVLVALVLIMVFVRDVEWLVQTAQDQDSIMKAQLSVIYEILFIMGVLMLLITNLIFSYSKNLKLLFNNQTHILEKVKKGDLSNKVPVATRDEFGVIAGHTNHMIDGLRHRFDLMNSLRLAEEVQQNLLPAQSPYLNNFEISGFSLYCDQTGGDYYDYFLLPDDKLGIVVADACGHGIGAAMLMTSVRAYLVSTIENYTDPATSLQLVNQLLTRDCARSGVFTTMFFLEIDQANMQLTWVRAGHEPALHYRSKRSEFNQLDGQGIVLGVEGSYEFTNETEEQLEPGDIILIGTDGIHETSNSNNILFGKERVQEILAANHKKTAKEIREILVANVQEFRGSLAQDDDITLVVIKVK